MVTAPIRLQNGARKHDSTDCRMKRWLAGIDHTLRLTWFEVVEGKTLGNLQMNRVMFGNYVGKYTTTYSRVKANLTPYLVCFYAVPTVRASRQGRQTRLKKCTEKYIS